MSVVRQAELAGGWYAADAEKLAAEVDECVRRAKAQYGEAMQKTEGTPVGILVPHAGLVFSGAVAAAAFELVRERVGRVDAFVVFGACHRARLRKPAIWAEGVWRTPLGDIEVDAGLAEALIADGFGNANPVVHNGDNAVELQTPFIRRMFPEAKIVPVAMGPFHESWSLGRQAGKVAAKRGGTVIAVASTDLTHYGAAFGVMPAGTGQAALDWVRANDARFVEAMANLEREDIVPLAMREHSACGAGAAAALVGWAGARGCPWGQLLAMTNSHEVMPKGRAEHFVGYASMVFSV